MTLDPQMIAVMKKRATLTGGASDVADLKVGNSKHVFAPDLS